MAQSLKYYGFIITTRQIYELQKISSLVEQPNIFEYNFELTLAMAQ